MRQGALVAELSRQEATAEKVLNLALPIAAQSDNNAIPRAALAG
jgi:hypothetical protein